MTAIYYHLFYLYPLSSWINKYLKSQSSSYARKNSLYEKACREIGEYTREPVETVKEKHKKGTGENQATAIFEHQNRITSESVENFYKEYSYYLYELPLWNAERARPYYLWRVIKPYILQYSYKKILDYGGGAGDLCLELASQGLDVAYYDISRPLQEFVNWRFTRRTIHMLMYNDPEQIIEPFDCVVSFDVFEHLKDLPGRLDIISPKIKKGGSLIFSGAFSGGSLHLEENEIYNDFKAMDPLLTSRGFRFLKKFAQFYFYEKFSNP